MINSQNPTKNTAKYLTLFSMSYLSIVLLTLFVENKVILISNIHILAGTLVLPLSYALSDIITEVYGYKAMRQILWYSIIILCIVAAFSFLLLELPSDHSATQNASYNEVLTILIKDILTYSIASLSGVFLNSYFLSKLKILTSGRFFALRSLGSTMIGEALFIIIWATIGFSGDFPFNELLQVMAASYACKIIYNLAAIVPCSILTKWLKTKEHSDVYDNGISFNPFSLAT